MTGGMTRRDLGMLGGAIAVGIATPWGLAALRLPGDAVEPSPVIAAVLNDPATPVIGNPRGNVTIVVFTDYRCPVCRRSGAALTEVMAADPGLRVLVKDWPALGPESVPPARVALAAAHLGRYADAHAALQASGGRRDAVRAAGLDPDRLDVIAAREAAAIDRTLAANAQQAWSLGLQGVPAFLVGERLVRGGVSARDLRRLIAAARAAPAR